MTAAHRQHERHPLNRLLAPITRVELHEVDHQTADWSRLDIPGEGRSIICLQGTGAPIWLADDDFRVLVRAANVKAPTGCDIVASLTSPNGIKVNVWRDLGNGNVIVPFSLAEAYENYVYETWRTATASRGLSPRQLNAFYAIKRGIPRAAQLFARRVLARLQSSVRFPAWPYDDSVVSLVRFYAQCLMLADNTDRLEFRWFWPEHHHAALVLTHDVESAEGLHLAVEIADIEEERGLRSSFNIVADWYPVDMGIIRELTSRGFELGVHGVYHDRSMFATRQNFEKQSRRVAAWAEEIGAVGFRSPATHRIVEWLGHLPVEYDCTIPHSDPYEPIPGGACTPWPFFVGDIVELPYTLPQDHTLFTILRQRTIDIWLRQVEYLEASFGLVQCVTHPDPGYLGDRRKRGYYVELLDAVSDQSNLWTTLPRTVARWWRERDNANTERVSDGGGVASLSEGNRRIELSPRTEN